MPRRTRTWLIGLALLAAALRTRALFANTFQADEALYASWARLIATWQDPLLWGQAVDKPPMLFYLQASLFPLMGGAFAWAARLPAFAASLCLVPALGKLVWRLYREELPAVLAAAFVTLSPLAVQFSATAFIDPLLTGLLLLALLALSLGRPGSAGLFFGLALASKHQALLFLPLMLGLGWLLGWRGHAWRRWLAGAAPVLLLVLLWGLARPHNIWAVQQANYGGLRLAASWELWPRLEEWGRLWQVLFGSPVVGFALALGLPMFLALLIHHQDRAAALDQAFSLFILSYALAHWFLAVPVWDRYLLPLLPLVALLVGRFVWRALHFVARGMPAFMPFVGQTWPPALLLLAVQLPFAAQARLGTFPVGGQPAADQGAAQVADFLHEAPYGTVLYDHWYGWQWRYLLFEQKVYVAWFPGPEALLDDLRVFAGGSQARYLALPPDFRALPVRRALQQAGYGLAPAFTARQPGGAEGMTLYRLVAP